MAKQLNTRLWKWHQPWGRGTCPAKRYRDAQ